MKGQGASFVSSDSHGNKLTMESHLNSLLAVFVYESGEANIRLYISVKLRIKSFRVPELFIEIPESATVGSLKVTLPSSSVPRPTCLLLRN